MTKKGAGSGKITSIDATKGTREVEGTESVTGVSGIKPTAPVSGVRGTAPVGRRRPTTLMSMAERSKLFEMIQEEADKLVKDGVLPANDRKIVSDAVKMAVDSGIGEEEDVK